MIRFERPFQASISMEKAVKPIDEFKDISDVVLFG
jgi:hypothetical protein